MSPMRPTAGPQSVPTPPQAELERVAAAISRPRGPRGRDRRVSYAELLRESRRCARFLAWRMWDKGQTGGPGRPKTEGTGYAENPSQACAMIGVRAGRGLHTRYKANELSYILGQSDTDHLL